MSTMFMHAYTITDFFLYSAEERQDQNAKRRKIEKEMGANGASVGPDSSLNLTAAPTAPGSLPPRPGDSKIQ